MRRCLRSDPGSFTAFLKEFKMAFSPQSIPAKAIQDQSFVNLSRRQCLLSLSAIVTVSLINPLDLRAQELNEPVRIPGKKSLLVHNDYPEDLETPLHYFDSWMTPNDVFFVRQHLPRPQVQEKS